MLYGVRLAFGEGWDTATSAVVGLRAVSDDDREIEKWGFRTKSFNCKDVISQEYECGLWAAFKVQWK